MSTKAPLIKIVGVKKSGKTSLAEKLIREFSSRGIRVAAIKHCHHAFPLDREGTDSYRLGRTGAISTSVYVPGGFAIFGAVETIEELEDRLRTLFPEADLLLMEGNKKGAGPKIEINRQACREGPMCLEDPELVALITDRKDCGGSAPVFHPDDIEGIVQFIHKKFLP